MVVEYVAEPGAGADLPPTHADCPGRIAALHNPCADVEKVNVLLDVEVAGKPCVVIPVACLPVHVGVTGHARPGPDCPAVIIGLEGVDLPQGAVVDSADEL